MESSGSVGEQSGWSPQHLLIFDEQQLIGLMPLYLKTNSYGEYVFDFQWANAYHQSGIEYFPKLVTSIPFTPCTGPRICLKRPFQDSIMLQKLLPLIIRQIQAIAQTQKVSSWHLLFPDVMLDNQLAETDLLRRTGVQYHWFNRSYESFDDFLSQCKSKKRKNIRRERRIIEQAEVNLEFVEGSDASGKLWMQFFKFYQRTYLKRSGNFGYLNWAFFEYIANAMPEQLMFVVANFEGKIIGMSLFFKGTDTLYGRYWGAAAEYEFLHFEACYYQAIEYCIRHKIGHFDAGAQGEHKIQRGFEPIETCSFHWIEHPQFRQAIQNFLEQEKKQVDSAIDELALRLPFKS